MKEVKKLRLEVNIKSFRQTHPSPICIVNYQRIPESKVIYICCFLSFFFFFFQENNFDVTELAKRERTHV